MSPTYDSFPGYIGVQLRSHRARAPLTLHPRLTKSIKLVVPHGGFGGASVPLEGERLGGPVLLTMAFPDGGQGTLTPICLLNDRTQELSRMLLRAVATDWGAAAGGLQDQRALRAGSESRLLPVPGSAGAGSWRPRPTRGQVRDPPGPAAPPPALPPPPR